GGTMAVTAPPDSAKSISSVPNRTLTPGVASASSRSSGSRVYCDRISGGSSGSVPSLTSSVVVSSSATVGYRCRVSGRASDPAQITTSSGASAGSPAARSRPEKPSRRKISMTREPHRSARGTRAGAGLTSTTSHPMPSCPRLLASVSPAGPPPAISTGTSELTTPTRVSPALPPAGRADQLIVARHVGGSLSSSSDRLTVHGCLVIVTRKSRYGYLRRAHWQRIQLSERPGH